MKKTWTAETILAGTKETIAERSKTYMGSLGTPLIIGLISDTHGLLRDEVMEIFAENSVGHILHAGDVCDENIICELGKLAPVSAVRGNSDLAPGCRRLPLVELVNISSAEIYLHHGHLETFEFLPPGVNVVISGHTHIPKIENSDGILRINPGSAGPRRPGKPVSIALLTIYDHARSAEIIELLR